MYPRCGQHLFSIAFWFDIADELWNYGGALQPKKEVLQFSHFFRSCCGTHLITLLKPNQTNQIKPDTNRQPYKSDNPDVYAFVCLCLFCFEAHNSTSDSEWGWNPDNCTGAGAGAIAKQIIFIFSEVVSYE